MIIHFFYRSYGISVVLCGCLPPGAIKSFCDEQEAWHARKMKTLFETKQSFTKARKKRRVSYNARSAYMKTHSLNATTVKEPWDVVKQEGSEVQVWKNEASRLTVEGNNVYVIKDPGLLLLGSHIPHTVT